jgi:hypothetical protein
MLLAMSLALAGRFRFYSRFFGVLALNPRVKIPDNKKSSLVSACYQYTVQKY